MQVSSGDVPNFGPSLFQPGGGWSNQVAVCALAPRGAPRLPAGETKPAIAVVAPLPAAPTKKV